MQNTSEKSPSSILQGILILTNQKGQPITFLFLLNVYVICIWKYKDIFQTTLPWKVKQTYGTALSAAAETQTNSLCFPKTWHVARDTQMWPWVQELLNLCVTQKMKITPIYISSAYVCWKDIKYISQVYSLIFLLLLWDGKMWKMLSNGQPFNYKR